MCDAPCREVALRVTAGVRGGTIRLRRHSSLMQTRPATDLTASHVDPRARTASVRFTGFDARGLREISANPSTIGRCTRVFGDLRQCRRAEDTLSVCVWQSASPSTVPARDRGLRVDVGARVAAGRDRDPPVNAARRILCTSTALASPRQKEGAWSASTKTCLSPHPKTGAATLVSREGTCTGIRSCHRDQASQGPARAGGWSSARAVACAARQWYPHPGSNWRRGPAP